jgi:hypothetical protein
MERWLCHQNIARLRDQLTSTTDEDRRRTLLKLLEEEKTRLEDLGPAAGEGKPGR